MKALRVYEYGGSLQLEQMADPIAGAGQVVVRNLATSLNPIDPGRVSGFMRQIFPLVFPWTPGGDVSGVIESVGEGVTGLTVGDTVFGYSVSGGAYAERIAVDAAAVALRPATLSVEEAAAVAIVGQTAVQSLELMGELAGKTLLVHGGAGGVGVLVIQLAHKAGATVIVTAQEGQRDALLKLGANRVIDHVTERFEEILQPVDAILDLVGGDTLARSYAMVKPSGVLVTANQPPDQKQCEEHGIQGFMVQSKVTTEGLNGFVELMKMKEIEPVVDHTETLWSTESIWAKRPSGTAVGKIVFDVASL